MQHNYIIDSDYINTENVTIIKGNGTEADPYILKDQDSGGDTAYGFGDADADNVITASDAVFVLQKNTCKYI